MARRSCPRTRPSGHKSEPPNRHLYHPGQPATPLRVRAEVPRLLPLSSERGLSSPYQRPSARGQARVFAYPYVIPENGEQRAESGEPLPEVLVSHSLSNADPPPTEPPSPEFADLVAEFGAMSGPERYHLLKARLHDQQPSLSDTELDRAAVAL